MEFHQSGVPSNQEGTHLSDSVPSPGAVFSESSETLSVPSTGLFGFRNALGTIMRKRDRASIQLRELDVVFKDLRIVGLGAATGYQPIFGSFFNARVIVENIQARASRRHPALRDSEGIVRPGEMLRMLSLLLSGSHMIFSTNLVLGNPGSGCSPLLKTCTNLRAEYHHVEGEVYYDSPARIRCRALLRGHPPEDGIHFPKFRVDVVVRFAAKVRAPHNRLGLPRSRYVRHITDIARTKNGLRHVKNTPVGDAAIREYSIWRREEASTRGLDASTALEFVLTLRIATDVRTYQPSYFDRAEQARQYFIDLGFGPSHRQTVSLLQVHEPLARTVREDFKGPVPQTAAEFASTFLASESAGAEHATMQRKGSAYTISIPIQARAVMLRCLQILPGNPARQLIVLMYVFLSSELIFRTNRKPAPFTLKDETSQYFARVGILFLYVTTGCYPCLRPAPDPSRQFLTLGDIVFNR
ncbi:hypothetical protein EDB85DRAFT_2143889 [Lactarius pseudohatsudake]|nr:hypothetical protein EDB85DRAFT_2143889 [Lactarius pseudohatsudake]